MAETFYTVLGVDSDADTDAIRDAYRAQVKETHPDVSDDDDAAATFKRLTAARDVLVDESSRSRYDRVGHAAYVRNHLDSSAWSVEETGTGGRTTGSRSTEDGSSDSGDATGSGTARDATGGGSRGGDSTSGRSTSGGSTNGGSTSGGSSGGGTRSRRRGGRDGSTAENYQRYRSSKAESAGDGTTSDGRTSRSSRRDTGDHGTWSTQRGSDWAFSGATRETAAGGRGSDSGTRARADGWEAAHAATSAYTPSGFEPTGATDQGGVGTFRAALLEIGPWLAFHFVFLISAFVTIWLIMTWVPSVPMLFASVVLLGATVFFSILHMVSQVYS